MCGRFAQKLSSAEIAERFGALPLVEEPQPRYNLAPSQTALVVVQHEDDRRVVRYRWGLVPPWEIKGRPLAMANVRSDTVQRNAFFRDVLGRRRCIVPVDAFYEWGTLAGHERQPYAIESPDGSPLALAGLWSTIDPPEEGAPRPRVFTLITTDANGAMAPIHDRMPVILQPNAWDLWLADEADPGALRALLQPAPTELTIPYPISKRVGNVKHDDAELLRPIEA